MAKTNRRDLSELYTVPPRQTMIHPRALQRIVEFLPFTDRASVRQACSAMYLADAVTPVWETVDVRPLCPSAHTQSWISWSQFRNLSLDGGTLASVARSGRLSPHCHIKLFMTSAYDVDALLSLIQRAASDPLLQETFLSVFTLVHEVVWETDCCSAQLVQHFARVHTLRLQLTHEVGIIVADDDPLRELLRLPQLEVLHIGDNISHISIDKFPVSLKKLVIGKLFTSEMPEICNATCPHLEHLEIGVSFCHSLGQELPTSLKTFRMHGLVDEAYSWDNEVALRATRVYQRYVFPLPALPDTLENLCIQRDLTIVPPTVPRNLTYLFVGAEMTNRMLLSWTVSQKTRVEWCCRLANVPSRIEVE